MPTGRPRVRKPISPRGLMLLALLIGIALAIATMAAGTAIFHAAGGWNAADPMTLELTIGVGAIAIVLLSLLLTTVTVALVSPRAHHAGFAVFLQALAALLTSLLIDHYMWPYVPYALQERADIISELTDVALAVLVGPPIAGLLATAIALGIHLLTGRPVVQDGTLCWRCAYPITAGASTRCPECGTPIDDGAKRRHLMHRWTFGLKTRARTIAFGLVVLVTIAVGWLVIVERSFVRFMRNFEVHHASLEYSRLAPLLLFQGHWASIHTVLREPANEPTIVFELGYFRRLPHTPPRVVIAIGLDVDTSPGGTGRDRPLATAFVEVPAAARRSILRDGVSPDRLRGWSYQLRSFGAPDDWPIAQPVERRQLPWLAWEVLEPAGVD